MVRVEAGATFFHTHQDAHSSTARRVGRVAGAGGRAREPGSGTALQPAARPCVVFSPKCGPLPAASTVSASIECSAWS